MNNNYKLEQCEICEQFIQINVDTFEISHTTPTECDCISCPYSPPVREGGDPTPLKFD